MKKRWLRGAAAAALAGLMLTGCSMPKTSIDSLLAPPRLNDEQSDIYAALVRETGADIRLLYPQKGSNRSAFLITNLDGEATPEALVFYQSAASGVSGTVRLNVLDKQEDRWVSVNDLALDGSQVEDVTLMNVGTGAPMVAVGLNYAGDGASLLKIFSFNGKTMDVICSESYLAKIVFQKKQYFLGVYDSLSAAAEVRRKAEEVLNRAVVGFYEKWAERATADPGWAEENPIRITVCKSGGAGLDVRLEPVL